jgi:hypothetical protein
MPPASRAITARTCLRKPRTCWADGGSELIQSLVRRPAPSGSDALTSGSSSIPDATSSEPPPMSITSSRPEDQPNHRRAARNVRRASSGPVITVICAPVCSRIRPRTCSPFTASRTAEVANAIRSSTPLSSAICSASSTMPRRLRSPGPDSELPFSRDSASLSSTLCENAGVGRAPW